MVLILLIYITEGGSMSHKYFVLKTTQWKKSRW